MLTNDGFVLKMVDFTIQLMDFVLNMVGLCPGVASPEGKLNSMSRPFFGMTAGNGEFW